MRSARRFFARRPARKHCSNPKTFRIEQLEVREMMAANALAGGPIFPMANLQDRAALVSHLPPVTTNPGENGNAPVQNTGAYRPLSRSALSGLPPVNVQPGENAPPKTPLGPALPDVFRLSSLPGAPATLFLDFDGVFASQQVSGWDGYEIPEFSRDDSASFSTHEKWEIYSIWSQVAEYYAPFNINVTTVDPGDFSNGSKNLRVTIGGADPRDGSSKGGFADYDAFSDGAPNIAHAFSFSKNSQKNLDRGAIAIAAAHEAGHAFGLRHYDADAGHGNELKRPLMQENGPVGPAGTFGEDAVAERGTWWKGSDTYYDAEQDDMAIIAGSTNGFGYRPDDHANTFGAAAPLTMNNIAGVLQASGVIEKMSDVDIFRFDTGGGAVSIRIALPQAIRSFDAMGFPNFWDVGNLDATLGLYNSSGQLLAQDSDPSLLAGLTANLSAGTYYVKVGSFGGYGDVGQYTVTVDELAGPQIIASRYESISATLANVWVTFNETIDASSFTIADVAANGVTVKSVNMPFDGNGREFAITVTKPVVSAKWSLKVGPNINDLFGNAMDQNANGVMAEAADYYFASFGLGGVAAQTGSSINAASRSRGVSWTIGSPTTIRQ